MKFNKFLLIITAEEKMYVARNNHSFKLADVERLFHKAKETITPAKWANAESFVIDSVETKFWELDGVMEDEIPPFVITINESDDDDSDDDDDTEDDDQTTVHVAGPSGDAMEEEEEEEDICGICGNPEPPITDCSQNIEWVMCDLCECWIHVVCTEKGVCGDMFRCAKCERILRVGLVWEVCVVWVWLGRVQEM